MSNCNHTSNNSWWENDVKGIPLCRVCAKCEKEKLATYNPSVLSEEQQMTAFGKVAEVAPYEGVEETVEADY
jgi:hypothetical protein